jgi:hypothetical protein
MPSGERGPARIAPGAYAKRASSALQRRLIIAAGFVMVVLTPADGSAQPAANAAHGQPRPFRHDQHAALSCTGCHGPAERHRVDRAWSASDCAACHHDPARGYECVRCHTAASVPAPRLTAAALTLTVWAAPRQRDLPFDHATHAAKSCEECHAPPAVLPPVAQCSTCHADHHRPEADCSACHRPDPRVSHDLRAHLTCAGSECHSRADGDRPVVSRQLCLLCHTEQSDHEPDLNCYVCHKVPPEVVAATGQR